MEVRRAFRVVDDIGNQFLCQHIVDHETDSEVIKIGSPYRKECIHIEIVYDFVDLHTVLYDSRCSYGHLERGIGTKSMVLSALNAVKRLKPTATEFGLQDNSSIVSSGYNLSDYYVLTRGVTWYQTYLPIKLQMPVEEKVMNNLVSVLSKQVTTDLSVIIEANGLTNYWDKTKRVYDTCQSTKNCTWLHFHTILFNEYPEFRNQQLFENIMKYHSKGKLKQNFFGTYFVGKLNQVQNNITEFNEIPMIEFGQIGGGNYERPKRKYLHLGGGAQIFDEQETLY